MNARTIFEKWPLLSIYVLHWEYNHRPGGPCSFEKQLTTGTMLLCMAAAEVNQHKAGLTRSAQPLSTKFSTAIT
jgi:hypothetical protein